MANRAYLCCSPFERTYPSFENDAYLPQKHTLASSIDSVPLLWLGLFRPSDLRVDRLVAQGQVIEEPAPMAPTTKALEQLEAVVSRLQDTLPDVQWSAWASAVSFRIGQSHMDWVTIELQEIAYLHKAEEFYAAVAKLLAWFDGDSSVDLYGLADLICGADLARIPPVATLNDLTRDQLATANGVVGNLLNFVDEGD